MLRSCFAALILVAAPPALAQTEPASLPTVDLVAAIIIGFSAAGTAMVNGTETANIVQTGPCEFSGTIEESGAEIGFSVVESEPCRFDAAYNQGAELFRVSFNPRLVTAFAFVPGEAQAGYTFYDLTLEATEGAVEAIAADGTRRAAGNSNRIGTSLTLEQLEAMAAELRKRCPAA